MFATYGRTESGDDIPVILWDKKPSDEAVHAAYALKLPHEYEEGCPVNYSIQGVTLPKSVQDDLDLLAHLEANGVDNWEGYSHPDWEDDEEDEEDD